MQNLKGIIFDMDGLMFDTELIYYQATQQVADEMGFDYNFSIYEDFIGISDAELWQFYHQKYDPVFGQKKVSTFIDRAFNRGIELFEAGTAKMKPGLLELLDFLDKEKLARVIATSNQRRIVDILLKNHGLTKEFSHIISFENVTRAKPDPEIFLKAQSSLALAKHELLILEDSTNGILAAEKAGINVVMVPDLIEPTPVISEKTLAILPSLKEIPNFLKK
ncbi:MAG TPA: HAD family phosphatase [Tetragenococcus sp.]|nr:HAD family phosphatase [Tetragenococcus sp.]